MGSKASQKHTHFRGPQRTTIGLTGLQKAKFYLIMAGGWKNPLAFDRTQSVAASTEAGYSKRLCQPPGLGRPVTTHRHMAGHFNKTIHKNTGSFPSRPAAMPGCRTSTLREYVAGLASSTRDKLSHPTQTIAPFRNVLLVICYDATLES